MGAQTPQFEILSVRPAKAGAKYLAIVSFAFRPSEFQPLKVVHSSETDGKWKNYVDAEIDGARLVRVHSSFLRRSEKGELYIQSTAIDLAWDLSRAIADEAASRLKLTEAGHA